MYSFICYRRKTLDTCQERWPIRLFGYILSVELGGLSDLRMAHGLMTLFDELNLKGVSLLSREVLGLEAEGKGGYS